MTKRIGEATETKNSLTTIEGFGQMPFMTLGVLFSAEKERNPVRLNDARNNKLTNAKEICKRNMHLMEEYCSSKPGYTSETTSLSGVSDHFDDDDLQQVPHETFAYDLKKRKELKQIRTINRPLITIVKYRKGNRKSQDPQFIRHIPLLKQRILKRAFAGGVKV